MTGRRPRRTAVARRLAVALGLVAVAALSVVALPSPVQAATDMVTNCDGSGPGSLPALVENAAPDDVITFASSLSPCPGDVITLAATIDITRNVSIEGPGENRLAVSGDNAVGVFHVASGVTATISRLAIENGAGNYDGGGIYNSGVLTVSDSVLEANSSGVGGAISNVAGTLTVTDSTVSFNNANDVAGGIWNDGTSSVTILDSTVSYNSAVAGGGIWNEGRAVVTDSTLSGNSANTGDGAAILNYGTASFTASTLGSNDGGAIAGGGVASLAATIVADSSPGDDCSEAVADAGYNVDDDGSCGLPATDHNQSDVDPDLGPLQNNGGPTLTQAPAAGSPVLDQIPLGATAHGTVLCPGLDQRGVTRPQGAACDVGAVDLVPTSAAITSTPAATATVGSPLSFTVTTTGLPVPSLTEKGRMPRHVTFVDNHDGTATISGIPTRPGMRHLTITATFGTAPSSPVAQAFTLTIAPRQR